MRITIVFLAAFSLSHFGARSHAEDDPHTLQLDHAPTPFTADQIRQGCRDGRKITWRHAAPGRAAYQQTFTFEEGDAEGALLVVSTYGEDGKRVGEPMRHRGKWKQFQSHASFPASDTRIVEEDQETVMGIFACLHYEVSSPDGRVSDFWFAKDLPGPPIRVEVRRDGRLLNVMTMTGNTYPAASSSSGSESGSD